MELKGKKINYLGDSITEGCGTSGKGYIYHDLIAASEGVAVSRNYGIGGSRLARQKVGDHLDDAYVDRFDKMDDDADIVVVFGGTNDYGHGDAKIGCFADRCPDTLYGALHLLISGLIDKYPDATIVFMTPLHRSGDHNLSRGNQLPLSAYVDIIKELTAYYSIPTLDLWSVSSITPAVESAKAKLIPDGLHPNDEGHKRLAARLAGFLKSL